MKFTKQDLLTMLIGLFLFSSCKDSNTIGLDLEDGQAINAELYNETAITSLTQPDIPANTLGLIRYPLGYTNDDVFGITEATSAITLNAPSEVPDFGGTSVIDSAILILPYNQFYGDSTQTYTVTVNQLKVDLSTKKSFLSNMVWDYNKNTSIGSYSGIVKPNTKLKVTDIVKGQKDTLKTVVPQLRIKLDNAFIQNNILSLDTSVLKNNDAFVNIIKGLHVKAKATGKGGMMFFDFRGTEAKMELFYKKPTKNLDQPDTVAVSFPILSDNTSPVAATITHNYSSVPKITEQLDNPQGIQYPLTYLQPMSGLKNKISFDFTNFKTKLAGTKVSINKAELVIDISPRGDAHFTPSPRLVLYRYDAAGQRANVPDNDNSVSGSYTGDPRALQSDVLFGGYFDSVNSRYVFTITSYVQDLINGKTKDYGTFLAPTPIGEFNIFPSPTTAAPVVVLAPKNSAGINGKGMKLNIYYTKVN